MFYFLEPVPNCDDPQMIQSYAAQNKTYIDCKNDRRKFVAGKIYLGATIFNGVFIILTTALFVYCASAKPTSTATLEYNTKNIMISPRRHSLKQRSVMGTVLGAIGHFIFSTSVFLAQALNGIVACEMFLFGAMVGFYTWIFAYCTRAYQLKYMFRLNQLKVKYLRMSTAERLTCLEDQDYMWYVNNKAHINTKLVKPYILYMLTVCFMLAIAIPCEVMYVRRARGCSILHGAILVVTLFASFIVILVPFILWYLRNNADAHGIRAEFWICAIIGIPFFILYIVFFVIYRIGTFYPNYEYQTFAPVNWVVIFTAFAHTISVVIPVIAYLPIRNKHWVNLRNTVGKYCNLQRRTTSSSHHTFKSRPQSPRTHNSTEEEADAELATEENNISNSSPTRESFIPDLSIDSLERAMTDTEMMHQLQDLAIRDFSSENLLFYESYLKLETKFKEIMMRRSSYPSSTSKGSIQTYLLRKPTGTPAAAIESTTTADIEQQVNLLKFLSTPLPRWMYGDCVQFYETFIREDTSSQVNISYRARHTIDEAFVRLYSHYPDLNPRMTHECTSIVATSLLESASKEKLHCEEILEHEESIPVLTFGVFEMARIEVCWNIFNSVYPKLVEMYH